MTSFEFHLDPASTTPKNEQLTQQVQDAVKANILAPGTKLPTVRSLATELDVAPYTIARAYRQLEDLGVIETHGRNGTIVSTHGDTTQQQAQLAAHEFARRMAALKVAPNEALSLAEAALRS